MSGVGLKRRRLSESEIAELFMAARSGDRESWNRLVEVFNPLIWAICRAHGLGAGDSADVTQVTWLRLVENLDSLSQPGRVAAWLATTARRECLRLIRDGGRVVLVGEAQDTDRRSHQPQVDDRLLADEEAQALTGAFTQAPIRCQVLLRLLTSDPPLSYQEISGILDMPIGSIGPTRQRCLGCLRRLLEASQEVAV